MYIPAIRYGSEPDRVSDRTGGLHTATKRACDRPEEFGYDQDTQNSPHAQHFASAVEGAGARWVRCVHFAMQEHL